MTNRELAKSLGVSAATFSMIINNKPGISTETRRRVQSELDKRGLSTLIKNNPQEPAMESICFVIYKRHGEILDVHPFFRLLMENIEECAHSHGYNLLLYTVDRRNLPEDAIRRLSAMPCKGLIICATEMELDDIEMFRDLKMPYIILDNDFPFLEIDSVSINNTLGTYQAIEHLVKMGHTDLGYLKSSSHINNFDIRAACFEAALKHFHLSVKPQNIYEINYTEEGSYQDFRRILKTGITLPTAFFSDDDTIVAGAIKALSEFNYRVPQDVSIIGFNDRPICMQCNPCITSIRVPKYAFSAMAVDLLVKRIKNDKLKKEGIQSYKYCIGTELMERDSVKKRIFPAVNDYVNN